ncbi:MAG: Collagenase [Myxococcaceae bacterium]|nr:Collagenase [Myxococcaceae bacterium]
MACALCAGLVSTGLAVHKVRADQANWQLVADDEGIKVWSLAIPGQDLPGFRGITQVNASVEQVMKFVLDVPRHTEWQYNCDESRLVKRYDETHGILYNRINAPWPVYDRDVLLDINYRYTPQRTAVTFRFRNTEDFEMKVPRRVVRIPRLEGFFRIWQESPNKTNILYQVEVDIGGDVPDRAARRYAKNLPFETLEKLRELIEDDNKRS